MKVAGGEVIASLIHACNGITDREIIYTISQWQLRKTRRVELE